MNSTIKALRRLQLASGLALVGIVLVGAALSFVGVPASDEVKIVSGAAGAIAGFLLS